MKNLEEYSVQELEQILAAKKAESQKDFTEEQWNKLIEKYPSPVGIWKVTTEGDCEGRSVKSLGVYEGHIVDIASMLADQSIYGLRFSSQPKQAQVSIPDSGKNVSISLNIDSGTWDVRGEIRASLFGKFLHIEDPKYFWAEVEPSNYYACINLKTERLRK